MRSPLLALLALAPFTTAFYPYLPTDPHTRRSQSLDEDVTGSLVFGRSSTFDARSSPRSAFRPKEPSNGHIRMNLRWLPSKRANAFNIVRADPPSQEKSVGINQDGTDFSYFCSFKLGTSNKEYFMLLDSAASNTWVMSSDCTNSACGLHTTVGVGDSTSLKVLQTPFSMSYGTGNVKGITGSDTVHIGSMSVPLTFGLAQNVSNEFASFPMDGIVGLGRPDKLSSSSGNVNAPSLMDAMISAKVISSKLFAISLWRNKDGGSNDGELNFGKPDSSRYDGSLNYIAAVTNTNGFWEIPLDDASVSGKTAGFKGRTAIIDSGTSYILVPHDDAVKLHNSIPGSLSDGTEMFTVPCDASSKLQFIFGGKAYDISPEDYVGRQITGGCSSNIIGRQTFGATQWLVGDVFMKNVYTVFDFDSQRVGFGVRGGKSSAAAVSSLPSGTHSLRFSTSSTAASSATTSASFQAVAVTGSVTVDGASEATSPTPSAPNAKSTTTSSSESSTTSASASASASATATGVASKCNSMTGMCMILILIAMRAAI